jgi:DNA polymerase III delta subunit
VGEIQSRLKLADYPFQKTLAQAKRYSGSQLRKFYEKLLETDIAIKTGKYADELALNILVVELCQS